MIDLRHLGRPLGAALALVLLFCGQAHAQGTLLQGGSWTQGHAPMYVGQGTSQAVVQDSGPAGGGGPGVGLGELNITVRGTGTAPYANAGTGQLSTDFCNYDAPTTNATGYHFLCMSPNAQGGGLIAYGAAGGASTLPFSFIVNGTSYAFPFVVGGIVGPVSSVVNDVACWNNTSGTLLKDCGAVSIAAGLTNQLAFYPSNGSALSGLATANNGLLVTSAGGVPSISSTTPAGLTIVTPVLSGTITGTYTLGGTPSITATALTGTINAAQMPAFTGDVTSPSGSIVNTLATVNSNVGSFTNANITVNGKGLVTAASSGVSPVLLTGLSFSNLKIVNDGTTPNTKADITANSLVITNSSFAPTTCPSLNVVLDLTTGLVTSTANGMDGEARPTSAWVYIYAISNGSACASLGSSVSTNPTLPSGYAFANRIGAMRLDGSQNLLRTTQLGRRAQYVVTSTTNTANLPNLCNGAVGTFSTTTPTWASAATTATAPPTAERIQFVASNGASGGATANVLVAPNAAYAGPAAASNLPPIFLSATAIESITGEFVLETTNIFCIGDQVAMRLNALGWQDSF